MDSIYLFSGEEELIIQNKIDKIVAQTNADAFNVCSYDCEETNISKVVNELITPPFLGNQKVVIVKNPVFLTKNKCSVEHNVSSLLKYIADPAPFSTLIINTYGLVLDEKLEVTQKLLKASTVNNTQRLSRVEAEGWLKRQFTLIGYAIDDDAVRAFFDRMGENLINAKSEFEKIICYLGERRYITLEDINKVVIREIETDVFALTNAIVTKKKEQIIKIYEDLILSGKNPMELFGLISKNLNNMLLVKKMEEKKMKPQDIVSSLGFNIYRVNHLIEDTKKYSIKEIENNILKFHTLDVKVKTGKIDPASGIEFLMLGIC